MIYRIAWWAGIAAVLAGGVAVHNAWWSAAVGLGLLAVVCTGIGLWEPWE